MESIEALKEEDDASFKEKVLELLKTQSSPPDLPFSMLDLKPGMIVPPQAAASKTKPAGEVVDLSIDDPETAHPVLQNPSVAQKLHDHRAKKAGQPKTVARPEDDMADTFTREEVGLVPPATPNPRMRQIDISMSSPPARAFVKAKMMMMTLKMKIWRICIKKQQMSSNRAQLMVLVCLIF